MESVARQKLRGVVWFRIVRLVALSVVGVCWHALTVQADTKVVPFFQVAERYDSNVYFFAQGHNLQDYVTTVIPGARIEHRGTDIEGNVSLQMTGEYYVKNPGLNYFFPSGSAFGNLNRLTARVDQRWRMQVSETFSYTPRPPAFVAPVSEAQAAATPATQAAANPDFVRGIQAFRANSIMNVATLNSQYVLTSTTTMTGSLMSQYMRFGNAFATSPTAGGTTTSTGTPSSSFFTTNFQTLTAGPEHKFTPRDTGTLMLQYQHMHFTGGNVAAGSSGSTFQIYGATGGWRHAFTPAIAARGSAGLMTFSPSGGLQYVMSGELSWTTPSTTSIVSYSRGIFPSFFIAAVPLVSQVVTVGVTHKVSENLSVGGALNYANNESATGQALRFTSYGGNAAATYLFSRSFSGVASYTYNSFDAAFGTSGYSFSRHVVSFMLRKEWR